MSEFLNGVTALRAILEITRDLPSDLATEVLLAAISQVPTDQEEPATILPFRVVADHPSQVTE